MPRLSNGTIMTTSAIELSGKQRVDMFFDREPIFTDWNVIRHLVSNKVNPYYKDNLLQKLKSYEPLAEADPREHEHWVDQQCLRLILLRDADKSLEGTETCEQCGTRKMDPLMQTREWDRVCLHCLEFKRQVSNHGGRGSCEFI